MPQSLKISDLRMEYVRQRSGDKVLAIEGLSLQVENSSFVSIVGPSGCGKSTLLYIIDGLVKGSAGSVTIDDAEVSGPGPDRAMVFQEASLLPWYTIVRNCAYGLECRGVSRKVAEKRARGLLQIVGLGGFEEHYPNELSIGMQQRANLARAVAVDPAILLMDEPFAALDAQTRELMQAELLEIWARERKTVLFVTHQIDEAVYLSDRVIVMSARPSRVIDDIRIDLPRPRSLNLKRTPEFGEIEQRIWNSLEKEVKRAQNLEHQDVR